MLAANFEVYRVAAEAVLAGEDFYAVAPDRFPDFYYLYPPITVLTFLPFAAVGLWTGFAIHTLLEVAVGLALAWVIVRWIERERSLERLDYALIAGFVVGSIHTVPSLVYGQVNLRMALLVAVGLWLLERSHTVESSPLSHSHEPGARLEFLAGVALAGAALLKVFPAAIGVLLLHLRAWRAVAGALVTGLGGLALGALLFGAGRTRQFFVDVLFPRTDDEAFVGGLEPSAAYVTVRRPISVLTPEIEPTLYTVFALAVLAPPVAYVYTDLETSTDRLVAAHATLVAIFVFFPSYPLYYPIVFATLVPALYLVVDPLARWLLVAGALLANVVLMGPTLESVVLAAPPAIGGPLETVGFAVLTVASPVLLGCLVMVAGCVVYRYRRSRGIADGDRSGRSRRTSS
ncbi:hypothetical protein B1756_08930 [Natrarchaeobaculum aegyptiacum]|uniref:DUF2029 domain-containing protein n=2 Tax=Natrarchaeobaculum aegyptiacum TaxID=745377 RepID=A0A2Z2HXC9_9EURY|nr:hypothetical protein B1756_08930 [Natrarchaeobaculum aegyptiacum]